MKNIPMVGLLMLGIGFAIGWVAKPAAISPGMPVTVSSVVRGATGYERTDAGSPAFRSPSSRKRALCEPAAGKATSMSTQEEMGQVEKMQAEMTRVVVDRQRRKGEQYIQRLADNLDLTPAQKTRLGTLLDERTKKIEGLDFADPSAMASMEDLAQLLDPRALEEQLEPTLTEDQKTVLAELKDREHQTKVDSMALKNLSLLQGTIEFAEGQRDEAYKILAAAAEEKLLRDGARPDPSSMFAEGMGFEIDPFDLGIAQAMTAATGDPSKGEAADMDEKQMAQTLREILDSRIEEKVEQLRPVLNEQQLKQYRCELKSKCAGMFGITLMSLESGDPAPAS